MFYFPVVKAKIKKSRIRSGNTVIYLKKKKRIVSGSLSKKERRGLNPYIPNGAQCECNILHTNNTKKNFIVMGNKTDTGEFTITFMAPWSRDKGFRRAVRTMKKGVPCDNGIIRLSQLDNSLSGGKSKGKGKGKKKGKGKGKKRKGKGKGKKKNKKGGKNRKDKKKGNNAAKP